MQTFLSHLRLTFAMLLLCGVLYPLVFIGIGKLAPHLAQGQPVVANGQTIGFANIGQANNLPQYFHPRPSAVGYNAASTGGSNKGPTNPTYLAEVKERVAAVRLDNPDAPQGPVPADLVTASGSGIDPDITPEAALYQAPRVAKARGLSVPQVQALIATQTDKPFLGIFGPTRINVLAINQALNQLTTQPKK